MFLWLALLSALIAFGLRVYRLSASDLTFDEAASAFIAGKPYPEMLAYLLGAIREHPPVYTMLLRAWTLAAGRSEYALRFFSVWFGALSVALTWRLGRRVLGAGAALAGAALLAVQPFHVHYSQDARMYTLMIVEGLLLFELFHHVRDDGKWHWWLLVGILAAVSVLTHYFMAFVLAAINIYAISNVKFYVSRFTFYRRWFGAQAIIGGLFAAYLFSSRAAYHLYNQLQGFDLETILRRARPLRRMLDDLIWGVQAHPWAWWSDAIIALVVIGLLFAIIWLPRARRHAPRGANGWLLPIYLLVPLVLALATPEKLHARYSAAVIPAYCLILGLVIAWLARRHWLIGVVLWGALVAANVNVVQINQPILKSEYGRTVRYLDAHAQAGDAIILNGPWQWVLQLYYPTRSASVYWLPPYPLAQEPASPRQQNEVQDVILQLENIAAQFERAWVLPAAVQDTDPNRVVFGWLNEHAYYSGNYKELALYTFAPSTEITHSVRSDFGNAFRLRQVSLPRASALPGEPVLVGMSLRVLDPPGGDLEIGLQLVDRDGNVWNTTAFQPGEYFNPPPQWQAGAYVEVRRSILVPTGAPPGDYALRISAALHPSQAALWPGANNHPLPDAYIQVDGVRVLPDTRQPQELPDDENVTPLAATFGAALDLAGVRLAGDEFWQGHYAAFDLFWRPRQTLTQDYHLRLALVDSSGREAASAEVKPVADWWPTSQWRPGQIVLDKQAILIPPRQPPGRYTLRVSILGADNQPLPITGARAENILGLFQRTAPLNGTALDLGAITVRPRERTFRAGAISHPLSITLGDSIKLLGYDWDGPPRPGQNVRLTLYWQTLHEMDTPYTVFTHIVGPGETPAGQKDNWPRDGDYPTPFWMPGEIVSDEYLIPFLPQAQAGEYRLEIGMYDAATGLRLPAAQDGQPIPNDAIVLERWNSE